MPAARAATLTGLARNVQALACANNIGGGVDGAYRDRMSDGEWSGTAVLSFKPVDRLLTYASYSRGYKAGGYNLDRAGLTNPNNPLFQLPGSQLSNAPRTTATGGATWSPAVGSGLRGLVHADVRYQSRINTGSDLLPEKVQGRFATVNARIGIGAADDSWAVEFWGQNVFDKDFLQVAASAPLQGGGSLATVAAGGAAPGNSLFIAFLGEPRTYGVTVRTKF